MTVSELIITTFLATFIGVGTIITIVRWIRSFYAIRSIPGPWFLACSEIPLCYWMLTGNLTWKLVSLHERYGPIIRIGPKTVSVASFSAAKAIYGPTELFRKGSFYDGFAPRPASPIRSIVSLRDPDLHRSYRALFECSFSSTALVSHEEHVQNYVELLVKQLDRQGRGEDGTNVVEWFDYMCSDIMGELAFGKSYGSLKAGKMHFWPATVKKWYKLVTFLDLKNRFPVLLTPIAKILGFFAGDVQQKTASFALKTFRDRVQRGQPNHGTEDFISLIKKHNPPSQLSEDVLLVNAAGFVGAGSDTVSCALTGLIYFLGSNSPTYNKLVQEVLATFVSVQEITEERTKGMRYLNAVIEEMLRMFPTVPLGGARESPGAVINKTWVPAGTEVLVHHWAIHHDAANFQDPLTFCPERWLNQTNEHSFPFLLGPRNCLGKGLALLQLRLTLAHIIFTFDFTLATKATDYVRECKTHSVWIRPELRVRFRRRMRVNEALRNPR